MMKQQIKALKVNMKLEHAEEYKAWCKDVSETARHLGELLDKMPVMELTQDISEVKPECTS